MVSNVFRAVELESKGDTSNAHKLYTETIDNINSYLRPDSSGQKAVDEEVYQDLFFVKSKILTKEQISAELDKLATEYPSHKDFFETLKSAYFPVHSGGEEITNKN